MTRKRQTIEGRRVDTLSPWVSLVEVAVRRDGEPVETYHGLEVADYVVVCARSSSGLIPVVRQFRPIRSAQRWNSLRAWWTKAKLRRLQQPVSSAKKPA